MTRAYDTVLQRALEYGHFNITDQARIKERVKVAPLCAGGCGGKVLDGETCEGCAHEQARFDQWLDDCETAKEFND